MAAALEELGFRGFFTKNRHLFIAGFSMFLTYIETSIYYRFIIKLRIAHTPYAIISSYKNAIYFLPENIALLVIILFLFKIDFPNFIMKNKLRFIFISSIFFALAHTTGLWAAAVPWYFPLFFVLPQFCIGLLLGVIRVKYNLISSIFLHFCFDFFLIIVMFTVRSTGFIPVVHTILAISSIFILFVFYACGFFNSIFLIKNRASKLITQMGWMAGSDQSP